MLARCLALVAVLSAAPAVAQRPRTPAQGTPERTAILDAVRGLVEREFRPATAIRLNVRRLGVLDAWALAVVEPRAPGGALLPEYAAACQCDCEVVALLRRQGARWAVADAEFDPCDAALMGWPRAHGAPPALLAFYAGSSTLAPGPARVNAPDGADPWLALRSQPSVGRGSRLARMPHGARVQVLACQDTEDLLDGRIGRWCRVRYDRREGWAFDAFLVQGD